jgi:hypothetical protein
VGLLQPLEMSSVVWEDAAMDFIEGLPRVNGKSVVLTVVDRFSMYVHFLTLGHPYTATTIARCFFNNIVRLHGTPSTIIVSDRVIRSSLAISSVSCFIWLGGRAVRGDRQDYRHVPPLR